ncbi:uncharacterized protein KY384_000173 [Bacidia gigantensis]|uniref:uncharacterized protein n=1 Tax=Bacidia gigantensis TaxID=2732470 RepID=UPI001D04103C|nr:uncharacterized protein KY384_000173 [Bacidia gigantensis]KAG8526180.1 hypothetical protein KY384_000173 [Bacidia gigantensis]
MFNPTYFDEDPMAAMGMFQRGMPRTGGPPKRFDEYYRCYPVAMLPGPERDNVNHGGKVIMPPSALDKLTRLHITYPMEFEVINGAADTLTHAGVLEFIAEEGKIYLPYWMMQTLALSIGDLVQIKSTELPPGNFIKLEPQSPNFLEISDPKAVLENAFRNFACMTTGDIFTFHYNDTDFAIKVLETQPSTAVKSAISVIETDVKVDFAPPVGYEEPKRSGTNTPRGQAGGGPGMPAGGMLHSAGTMAQAINYSSIAPASNSAAAGAKAVSSNFLTGGHKLKGGKAGTPKPSTPVAGASSNSTVPPAATGGGGEAVRIRRTNGPQPLRLPHGKLFFGYEVKPVRKAGEKAGNIEEGEGKKTRFEGQGQTLRAKKK